MKLKLICLIFYLFVFGSIDSFSVEENNTIDFHLDSENVIDYFIITLPLENSSNNFTVISVRGLFATEDEEYLYYFEKTKKDFFILENKIKFVILPSKFKELVSGPYVLFDVKIKYSDTNNNFKQNYFQNLGKSIYISKYFLNSNTSLNDSEINLAMNLIENKTISTEVKHSSHSKKKKRQVNKKEIKIEKNTLSFSKVNITKNSTIKTQTTNELKVKKEINFSLLNKKNETIVKDIIKKEIPIKSDEFTFSFNFFKLVILEFSNYLKRVLFLTF